MIMNFQFNEVKFRRFFKKIKKLLIVYKKHIAGKDYDQKTIIRSEKVEFSTLRKMNIFNIEFSLPKSLQSF